MGIHDTPHLPYSTDQWVAWFRDGILNPDLDPAGTLSILHYLADLEVVQSAGEGMWKLSGIEPGQSHDDAMRVLRGRLAELGATDRGFALVYFMPQPEDRPPPPLNETADQAETRRKKELFGKKSPRGTAPSSDLSNLQIVKKWGHQLRSDLDVEQKTISRLQGDHTTREDAQRLFGYMLAKTRQKAPPKQWEQLSRKRHR